MLSPRRCTPGLQRFKISLGTCEHGPGFQSTTWWGMAYSDWTMGSSWWKKMPRYLPQDKSKVFSGICKEEDDKKEHNENYYWNWFSFFGNDLLNNLCTSPRLPSQPCCRIKRHLKECCGSFAASGQDVAHFVIFLSEKKKIFLATTVKRKERKFILYLKHQDDRGWEHLLFLLADGDSYLRIFDLQWESCSLQMVTWTLHPVLTVAWVSWQIDKNLVGPRSEYRMVGKIHLSQVFPQPTEKSWTQILCNKSINPENMEL